MNAPMKTQIIPDVTLSGVAMNTCVIEAIERQKTTNLYDASKSIDDEIRELVRLATFSPTAFHLRRRHDSDFKAR